MTRKSSSLEKTFERTDFSSLGISTDNVIWNGHRRFAGCQLAYLDPIPVVRRAIYSTDPEFIDLLISANLQRVKSPEEVLREEIAHTDKHKAFAALSRRRAARLDLLRAGATTAGLEEIIAGPARRRPKISEGKQAMLRAAIEIIEANRDYWPLTLRTIHYRIAQMECPPLRNTDTRYSKAGQYGNNDDSYGDLSNLLTRARLEGFVPWKAIIDETRPVGLWKPWQNIGDFVRQEMAGLFAGYRRDLLQSQPAHIEIISEKMTVASIVNRVARDYGANTMVGRGFSSITAKYELVQRFSESGKEALVLLILSDHDPEGECIADDLVAKIRDEFDVDAPVEARRVAITAEQVNAYGLLPAGKATDKNSSRLKEFREKYGDEAYELEAFTPAQLEQLVRSALISVIDQDLFKQEQDKEIEESAELEARRATAMHAMGHNPSDDDDYDDV
jgi:hypothetical protein